MQIGMEGKHLAVLVALARHDDGGHSVLHEQHVVRGQRQRKRQPARLHAAAAVELQVCTSITFGVTFCSAQAQALNNLVVLEAMTACAQRPVTWRIGDGAGEQAHR